MQCRRRVSLQRLQGPQQIVEAITITAAKQQSYIILSLCSLQISSHSRKGQLHTHLNMDCIVKAVSAWYLFKYVCMTVTWELTPFHASG